MYLYHWFATEIKDEKPVGDVLRQAALRVDAKRGVKRDCRYLFSVDALEALFGATPDNSKSFLAVAIEARELSKITIADLAAQIAAGEASPIYIANACILWKYAMSEKLPKSVKTKFTDTYIKTIVKIK